MTVISGELPHPLSFLGQLLCFLLIFHHAADIWITGKGVVSCFMLLWAFNTCLFPSSPLEKMRGLSTLCSRPQQQRSESPSSPAARGRAPGHLLQTITDGGWVGHRVMLG